MTRRDKNTQKGGKQENENRREGWGKICAGMGDEGGKKIRWIKDREQWEEVQKADEGIKLKMKDIKGQRNMVSENTEMVERKEIEVTEVNIVYKKMVKKGRDEREGGKMADKVITWWLDTHLTLVVNSIALL